MFARAMAAMTVRYTEHEQLRRIYDHRSMYVLSMCSLFISSVFELVMFLYMQAHKPQVKT